MLLDLTPLSAGVDASSLLQEALDAGGPVELPAATLTLGRPVYVPDGAELIGQGLRSILFAPDRDALVAIPAGLREYDPATHIVANALDATRWGFRTHGDAGIRFLNTIADAGRSDADHWRAVRAFTVEATLARHGGSGGVCGLAWWMGGSSYRAAPWHIRQQPDSVWQEWIDFDLALADGVAIAYRFHVGPMSDTPITLRVRVDLDAGTIVCEVNGTALAAGDVMVLTSALAAGAILADNPGAPFWLGGLNTQAGGPCPPELGCADVTFHTFRLWRTANPPAMGSYNQFAWADTTTFVIPFGAADTPHLGDPAVYFTGEASGFGYLTPLATVPNAWVTGLRVEGVSFAGGTYGAGLTIASGLDLDLSRLRFDQGAVGLQVLGGPLPCYPVRIRDLFGTYQHDCLVRLQRAIVRECRGLTAKYPARSVIRADACGVIDVRDVFHAGENAGPANTIIDVVRLDGCGLMEVTGVLSNYEDSYGPRRSYLRVTGSTPDPSTAQVLRVRDFQKQALRAGALYLDTSGLSAAASEEIVNSF